MVTAKYSWFEICLSLAQAQTIHAKSLWSNSPARANEIINTTYPVGNGRLGAMSSGPAGSETLTFNLDTLWSGGPFEANVSYICQNTTSMYLTTSTELHWW
jgi:alpha-L-fucosidase 2